MSIDTARNLACPIDGLPLLSQARQLVCENGHSYDIARQGYVNLLPVQHKRSKQPGDSKDMVVARTQFLNSGVYQPVADCLADLIETRLNDECCLLDAGCGEGYYLDHVVNRFGADDHSYIGLDISKPAIVAATRRNSQISWVVGTNRQPPLVAASVDIILCVFGFQSFDGFDKCLKPGGKVILVDAGAEHLQQLRQIIYAEDRSSSQSEVAAVAAKGFSMIDTRQLCFTTGAIENEQLNNLLLMTPHLFRATRQGKAAVSRLQQLQLTVDVVFRVFEKH
jgi:23S rRNA (guanine745-N1)-methyltransferase